MTPKDYASMTDKVYEELRKQDWGTLHQRRIQERTPKP